jgi:plasmid maintenance system antidote protein VapI
VTFVVSSYLAAYNARASRVHDHIIQMMFNSPPALSDPMDLAKMLALLEMIEPLARDDFRLWRQTRAGLLSFPLQPDAARAHLAANLYVQMALKPHIVHIVGHTEAHHAATAQDVIDACHMARRVIDTVVKGQPDLTADVLVQARKADLVSEAWVTLDAIRSLAGPDCEDAFTDAGVLAQAVSSGILDAPHLKNNRFARGTVRTQIVNGASETIDAHGNVISEKDRISAILHR